MFTGSRATGGVGALVAVGVDVRVAVPVAVSVIVRVVADQPVATLSPAPLTCTSSLTLLLMPFIFQQYMALDHNQSMAAYFPGQPLA